MKTNGAKNYFMSKCNSDNDNKCIDIPIEFWDRLDEWFESLELENTNPDDVNISSGNK